MGTAPAGYKKLECHNIDTGELKGYLATLRNYAILTMNKEEGAWVQWRQKDTSLYLAKDTEPNDRFLGLAERGYGGWGLQGTDWAHALTYDASRHTIALSGTKRFLYGPYETLGSGYACWSEEGGSNSNILKCIMVD
ncbi:MAG: hypothetical protein Q4P15_01460 [Propionibacteriaceae bacterium]|nr:hypothetical protein [Propionibacteriaceae bacterium]